MLQPRKSLLSGKGWLITVIVTVSVQTSFNDVLGVGISAKSKICENVTITEKEVADFIFENYTPWIRPVKNARRSIDVSIRLILSAVNDVIEKDRILKLTGYLTVKWNNELQIWNDTLPYACLDSLIIPTEHVWLPEVATINSESHYDLMLSKGDERIRLYSNGTVSYRPGGTFTVFCDFNLIYFPFDEQTCLLQLESWRYTHPYQTLSISDPPVSFRYWIENEQWAVIGTDYKVMKSAYVTVENVFDHIDFQITMRRKVGFYLMNIIIPSIIISVAQIAVFTLPVHEVMKIHISFTCLLAYGVFQLMIIEDMPRTSDHIPLLSIYIDLSMAYIASAMLCEGIVFICFRKAEDKNHRHIVPSWLFSIVEFVGKWLKISPPKPPPKQRKSDDKHSHMAPIDMNCEPVNFSETHYSTKATFLTKWHEIQGKDSSTTAKTLDNKNSSSGDDEDDDFLLGSDEGASFVHPRHQRRHEEAKWRHVADVIDRFTMVIYFGLITLTPIGMFLIYPRFE